MTLPKPQTIDDLRPPFQRIGDPGWESDLRQLLEAYEVPLPQPVAEDDLRHREAVLAFRPNEAVRQFLLTIGPLDLEVRVLSLQAMGTLEGVWFRGHLSTADRARLPRLVAVLDYLGTGDFIAWDRDSDEFKVVGHDPAGIHPWQPTFDECIREQCIDLAVGYYGWPGDDILKLAEEAKRTFLRRRRGS